MLKQIFILFFGCILNIYAFGQTVQTAVPVKWEYYKVTEKNIALLLPKMPVLIKTGDDCREEETNEYGVYAEEIVYGLRITAKIPGNIKNHCNDKKDFSKRNFTDRIAAVKNKLKTQEEINLKQNNLDVIKIQNADSTYWFFSDLKNNRWYELWIVGSDANKPEIKNFIESVKFGKTTPGIEIGAGAERTFGDEKIPEEKTTAAATGEGGKTHGIKIVLMPRPAYTDVARQNSVTGVTRLKITFLANGGIGSVTPVTGLPYGLTEQAIRAAQKLVFIPARVNNKPMAASKIIEYSFSIY